MKPFGALTVAPLGVWLACAPAADHPSGAAAPGVESVRARGPAWGFDWRLRVASPSGAAVEHRLERGRAKPMAQAGAWRCAPSVEPRSAPDQPEFGFVACVLSATGEVVETAVVCLASAARPTDCGSGNLRLTDDGTRVSLLELGCRSPAGSCRARVEPSDPAGTARPGPGRFEWRLDVDRADGKPEGAALTAARGDIATERAGWSCGYDLSTGATPRFPAVALGRVACRSRATGATAETVVVCAEDPAQPAACNVGSLRLQDQNGPFETLSLSCRSPGAPCWE